MTITVATSKLIDVLTDALQTGDDVVGGIHMSTLRAPYREEPGEVDILAATSTTRYVVGHTWVPINGQVRQPSVWPIESTKLVLAMCKNLARKGEEHTVDIDMVMADPPEDAKEGDHPGWTITISESPALFDSDTEFQFHAHAEDKFPLRTVRRIFNGDPTLQRGDFEETPLTLWSAPVMGPLVAVAKRRKMQMQFFRTSYRAVQVVQIGDTWLGAAMPGIALPGEHGVEPSVDPMLGDAGRELWDVLSEMEDNGITVTVDNPKGRMGQDISAAADLLRNGGGVFMGRVDPPAGAGISAPTDFYPDGPPPTGDRFYREAPTEGVTSVEGTTGEDLPGPGSE